MTDYEAKLRENPLLTERDIERMLAKAGVTEVLKPSEQSREKLNFPEPECPKPA